MLLLYKIIAILKGHFTIFKHSFKKRVTQEYPEVKPNLPKRFRGKPCWDSSKCIACKICERVCPASAVSIQKTDENIEFNLDLTKCIFCGNCMYHCPKNAINLSKEFELASDDKSSLYIRKSSKDNVL